MSPSQKKFVRDYWKAKGKLDASRGKAPDFREYNGGLEPTIQSDLAIFGEEKEIAGKAYLSGYDSVANGR